MGTYFNEHCIAVFAYGKAFTKYSAGDVTNVLRKWREHTRKIPRCGAIILDPTQEHVRGHPYVTAMLLTRVDKRRLCI